MLQIIGANGNFGVICTKFIQQGTVIIRLTGVIKNNPNKYSIQINQYDHLHPHSYDEHEMKQLIWPYLNHSCTPSAYVDTNTLQLIALKDMEPNHEITFDYESTERLMEEPFECLCNQTNCRKLIKGKMLSLVQTTTHLSY